jgi:hypothetical protein
MQRFGVVKNTDATVIFKRVTFFSEVIKPGSAQVRSCVNAVLILVFQCLMRL